eukprot:7316399-Pyramimonas_sp.AAC.1
MFQLYLDTSLLGCFAGIISASWAVWEAFRASRERRWGYCELRGASCWASGSPRLAGPLGSWGPLSGLLDAA